MTGYGLMLRAACLAAAAATACHAEPQKGPIGARGIYVAVGPGQGRNVEARQAAFASPATGVYIRALWSTIQPQANAFDWSALDADVSAARRAGKRISIGVRAGEGTPDWLLASVPTSSFVVGHHFGASGRCATVRIPHPWAKSYQAAYGRMMGALAAHLRTTGAYPAVSIVKLTGMNTQTEELHLPSARAPEQPRPGSCTISDAAPIWRQAGYRPAAAFAAWQGLANAVNAAFPDKVLSLPVIGSNDFPTTDADGNEVRRGDPKWVDVKTEVILAGVKMFPGRFAVQWNGLNDKRMPEVLNFAKSHGAMIGLQSNLRRGPIGGAGCDLTPGTPGQPCTAEGYRAILRFAGNAGATFVEIWPADAARFSGVVAESAKVF